MCTTWKWCTYILQVYHVEMVHVPTHVRKDLKHRLTDKSGAESVGTHFVCLTREMWLEKVLDQVRHALTTRCYILRSYIVHPTSYILHPTSYILHPTYYILQVKGRRSSPR